MSDKCPVCGAPLKKGKCEYCGYEASQAATNANQPVKDVHIYHHVYGDPEYKKPSVWLYVCAVLMPYIAFFIVLFSKKYSPKTRRNFLIACGIWSIIVFTGARREGKNGGSDASPTPSAESNSVWAADITPIENFDYYLDGNEIYLKDYEGRDKKVRIASTYTIDGNSYNVVSLDGTFALERVTSVIIPEGVISISDNVLNSSGVEFVYIPSTLPEITNNFLRYFHDAEKIYYGGSEEQWNSLVTTERSEIDVKQIIFDADPNSLK